MVLEAVESMLQEIAHFQSKAFETDLDYALRYATESLEGQDTRLFVLRDQEQVLASVTVDLSRERPIFWTSRWTRIISAKGMRAISCEV